MTKMAVMPIYGKTFKNLLQNHITDGLVIWNEAFGTYQDCSNNDIGLTLTFLRQD